MRSPKIRRLAGGAAPTYRVAMRFLLLLPMLLPLLAGACDSGSDSPPAPDQPAWKGPGGAQSAPTGRLDRSNAGKPAPESTFQDPDGRMVSLSDFRGRPLLVNLWATWCAPCVVEMPMLDRLAEQERRVQVLAISMDPGGRDKVTAFFEQRRFAALEPYLDDELLLMPEMRVGILPSTILYDSEGRELWRRAGEEDWTSARAAALLREGVSREAAR